MSSSMDQGQHPSEYDVNLGMLADAPLFSGLPMGALKVLAYLSRRETIREGEYLFRGGEVDRQAYGIIEGTAHVLLERNGGETPLRQLTEGDFIGGLSLISDTERIFSVRAASRLTCLIIAVENLEKVAEQFPDAAVRITASLLEAVHLWESRFVNEHLLRCAECRSFAGLTLL